MFFFMERKDYDQQFNCHASIFLKWFVTQSIKSLTGDYGETAWNPNAMMH